MSEKRESIFLDFEFEEEKVPTEEGFGASRKVAKKIHRIAYLHCPVCGMNRKLNKTGGYYIWKQKQKGGKFDEAKIKDSLEEGKKIKSSRSKKYNPNKITAFNLYDLKNGPFISLREAQGRKRGIREVEIIKLSDIKKMPERDQIVLRELVSELREQCQKILEFTEDI